jgi:hypothetical protein
MVSNVSSSSQDTTFKKALVEWDVIGLVNLTPPPIFTLLGVGVNVTFLKGKDCSQVSAMFTFLEGLSKEVE